MIVTKSLNGSSSQKRRAVEAILRRFIPPRCAAFTRSTRVPFSAAHAFALRFAPARTVPVAGHFRGAAGPGRGGRNLAMAADIRGRCCPGAFRARSRCGHHRAGEPRGSLPRAAHGRARALRCEPSPDPCRVRQRAARTPALAPVRGHRQPGVHALRAACRQGRVRSVGAGRLLFGRRRHAAVRHPPGGRSPGLLRRGLRVAAVGQHGGAGTGHGCRAGHHGIRALQPRQRQRHRIRTLRHAAGRRASGRVQPAPAGVHRCGGGRSALCRFRGGRDTVP